MRCGALVATYQHLGDVAVRRGQRLLPGAPLGTVGRARPAPHVHLGVRVAASGAYVDPLTLLGGPPPSEVPLLPVARPRSLPRPLGPAPPRAPVRPIVVPVARPAAVPRSVGADRLPWPVWLGVGLVALGLPLGGGLVVARRRRAGQPALARTAA